MTSPSPLKKNSADLGDLEKWRKVAKIALCPSPTRGGAYVHKEVSL